MKPSVEDIEARLRERFADATIRVVDDSHLHIGHAGAQGGAGHFTVHVNGPAFQNLSAIARHRLVYDALADWMPHRIHALAIKTGTPT